MPATIMTTNPSFRRAKHHALSTCPSLARTSAISIVAIFLGVMILTVMVPTTAEAQSWWQKLKEKGEQIGEQIIDSATEKLTPSSDEQQEQQPAPTGESKPTYTTTQVRNAQVLLTRLGYQPGPVDGAFGSATASAINAYQADHGLPQTGVPSDELIAHMKGTLSNQTVVSTPKPPPVGASSQSGPQPGSSGTNVLPGGAPVARRSATGPFAGLTIIQLNDIEAAHAIAGNYNDAFWRSADLYLVTFVAAEGTYAAVGDFRGGKRCVAWSAAGGGDGKSITFGIKMDAYAGRTELPWCQPFTLTLRDGNKVQVVADNDVPAFGLKGRNPNEKVISKRISHDGVHDIVLRLPDIQPDFSLPAFPRQAIYGISLGPITPRTGSPRIRVGRDTSTHQVEIQFESFPGKSYGGRLDGRAAPKELTGWRNDNLIALWNREKPGERLPSNTFNATYIERFGEPSLFRNIDSRYGGQANGMWWLYDQDGRLLSKDDSSAANCLSTFDLWHDNTLWTFNEDIGPWGCSLVKFVNHDAGYYPTVVVAEKEGLKSYPPPPPEGNIVGKIREEMVAGDAMAYHHFMIRLGELAEARKKLGVSVNDGRKTPVVASMAPAKPNVAQLANKSNFEFLSVSLGMGGDQIMKSLIKKAFSPSKVGRYKFTVFQKGPMREPGSQTISVRYANSAKSNDTDARQITWNLWRKSGDYEVIERIYQRLTATYGEPDQCYSGGRSPHQRCEWTNSQGDRLHLQSTRHDMSSVIIKGAEIP